MDGEYVADGRKVRRSPTKTATGFRMGFYVCELSDGIDDEAAQEIADALNMHMKAHPEKH